MLVALAGLPPGAVADLLALLVRLQVLPQLQHGPGGGVMVGWPAPQRSRLESPPASSWKLRGRLAAARGT